MRDVQISVFFDGNCINSRRNNVNNINNNVEWLEV